MKKIFVIDDEKPTLTMFRLTLNAYGYTVFTAENGQEGLDVFGREKPPLVLTDIKMPGMDGIEVLKRIKQIHPETEVIIITGNGIGSGHHLRHRKGLRRGYPDSEQGR